jgi:hypothetical protein
VPSAHSKGESHSRSCNFPFGSFLFKMWLTTFLFSGGQTSYDVMI